MVNEQLVHEVVGALLGERSLRVVVVVERREDVGETFEAVARGLGEAVATRAREHLTVSAEPMLRDRMETSCYRRCRRCSLWASMILRNA